MIDRFLRRVSVRSRILSAFAILVLLAGAAVPLIFASQNALVRRVQQITEVDTRADRLLLLASTRVEASRVNLMRYVQDYAPSAYEAVDDVAQANRLLTEAQGLLTGPEQKATIEEVRQALANYQTMVGDVQAAREGGREEDVSRLLFQAYRLGNDIGQRIEQVVGASEERLAAANQTTYADAQRRLILFSSAYALAAILVLILAILIQRSITRPIAELRDGAEAFRTGQVTESVHIPVVGGDELTLLARAFNQMSSQVRDLIGTLEQRVIDRTRDLERRAVQLATAADVGRAAASILDQETLSGRVVELIRERFNLYYAALFLLDDSEASHLSRPEGVGPQEAGQERYAVLEAGSGEAGRRMREAGHKLEVGGMSMVGSACAQRQARIALDVGHEAIRFDNPLLPETRSEMALPLIAGDRVVGALDVQSTRPNAFSTEDIAVLQLVADQVTVAIQNARLFTQTQAAIDAERRAYGQLSRESWLRIAQSQPNLGYTSNEQGVAPVRSFAGDSMGPAGAEARLVPIRIREAEIGAIDARKPAGAGPWTEQEIQVIEAMADQLGVALDSARLYQETQRRAAQERLLGDVTARMRQTLDVDTVLRTAVRELGAALGLPKVEVRIAQHPDQRERVAPGPGDPMGPEGEGGNGNDVPD